MRKLFKETAVSLLKKAHIGADPDFIIIGAQKAGTTSLYNYLLQNPVVGKSLKKEIHYFDLNYTKGINWYRSHFVKKRIQKNISVIGEASPLYLYHPEAPNRVSENYPEIKLIVILRDPVERVISHYKHLLRHKLIPEHLTLSDVIKIEKKRRKNISQSAYYDPVYSVLHRGEYLFQLNRWKELFSTDQILILQNDQLRKDPDNVLYRIENFLKINHHTYSVDSKFNVSTKKLNSIDSSEINNLNQYYEKYNQELLHSFNIKFNTH